MFYRYHAIELEWGIVLTVIIFVWTIVIWSSAELKIDVSCMREDLKLTTKSKSHEFAEQVHACMCYMCTANCKSRHVFFLYQQWVSMGFNFFCRVSVPHLFRDIKITGETGAKLYTSPLCEAAKFTQSYCRYSTCIFYSSQNTRGVNSTLIVCDPDDIG
jgi:hypothetical protein